MKIFKYIYEDNIVFPHSFSTYFADMKYGIFDIEATGLSPKKSNLILSGFVVPISENKYQVIQYFAETLDDEAFVIEKTLEMFSQLDYIITFNGVGYDLSFMRERMSQLGMNKMKDIYNLDIYRIVRNFSELKKFLPNLKQKTLENYMGLWTSRKDEISGKESVDMYLEYLLSHDRNLEEKILLHNSDDVKQLNRLTEIIGHTDFHKAMFSYGFPLPGGFTITSSSIKKNFLHISGICPSINMHYYLDESGIKFNASGENFLVSVQLTEKDGIIFCDFETLDSLYPVERNYFRNCGGLYMNNYLVIEDNGRVNHYAANLLIRYIFERIIL